MLNQQQQQNVVLFLSIEQKFVCPEIQACFIIVLL